MWSLQGSEEGPGRDEETDRQLGAARLYASAHTDACLPPDPTRRKGRGSEEAQVSVRLHK